MFWTNIAYMPILLIVYKYFVPSKILQVILFPLNVWIAEIIIGTYLLKFWQRRAWFYKGEDAYFDGLIKLYYFPLWMILGVIYVLINYIEEKIRIKEENQKDSHKEIKISRNFESQRNI